MGIDTGLNTNELKAVPTATPLHAKTATIPRQICQNRDLERETGIEPASLAWKAKVLPLNYSRPGVIPFVNHGFAWWRRLDSNQRRRKPTDLQSAPLATLGTLQGKP